MSKSAFTDGVARVRKGEATAAQVAGELIAQLTDKELLWMLDGDVGKMSMLRLPQMMKAGPIPAGAIPRLGIPGVQFSDGPRGVIVGKSTAFPVTMARAATWDRDLELEVGRAMGREARAQGANYSGAVCVNLLRHPAWGRAQECYGEDPVLTGHMGAALAVGVQENAMACVKHFALNSIENSRFKVDVTVDEHALHEVYLPHFKTVIDAGADTVMSAYNSVNGKFAGENHVLLTDILREEWGFTGFVTSDWVAGTHDAIESLEAGLDIEMPLRLLRARELPTALKDGRISKELVLQSARRILSTIVRRTALRDPIEPEPAVVAGQEHRALARRVASQAAVLLKNAAVNGTPVLPLSPQTRRIAVIGALATVANTGDHGSSLVDPPSTSTPLEGLREAFPDADVSHLDGLDIDEAATLASSVDIVIVVAGMSFDDEGERVQNEDPDGEGLEVFGFPFNTRPVTWLITQVGKRMQHQFGRGGDRDSLALHTHDEQLITALAAVNPRTVVVMIGGSAILTEAWRDKVPAILMAWYPGMEGGRAIADVLTGAQEPGGRLPFAIATDPAHYPHFDSSAATIEYDEWWGQRKLDRDAHQPAFPLGFGLGYTTFDIALAAVESNDALVTVTNTGPRNGATIVQVYAFDTDLARPIPQLVGFDRIELGEGEVGSVRVHLDLTPTTYRDPATRMWHRRPGSWRIVAAAHSPQAFDGSLPLPLAQQQDSTSENNR
jgi:beta-glucosidase